MITPSPADDADLATRIPAGWGAHDPRLVAETITSRVYRVQLDSGATAVVKDLKPIDTESEVAGAGYLRWQDGRGAVRLLAQQGTMLLLEDAGDQSLLHHLDVHGDRAATDVMAAAIGALHEAWTDPLPTELRSLEAHLSSLFVKADADRRTVGSSPFVHAADLSRHLMGLDHAPRPLHGDVHHGNLLESPRGWLAIDPRGLIGDPVFDVANMFYNPLDRDDLRLDVDRIRAMAHVFSEVLGRDPSDVLGWAIVDITLSAAWATEDGRPDRVANDLRIVSAIRAVRDHAAS